MELPKNRHLAERSRVLHRIVDLQGVDLTAGNAKVRLTTALLCLLWRYDHQAELDVDGAVGDDSACPTFAIQGLVSGSLRDLQARVASHLATGGRFAFTPDGNTDRSRPRIRIADRGSPLSGDVDLQVALDRNGPPTRVHVDCREQLYDADTVEALCRHLSGVLAAPITDNVETLAFLDESERRALLVGLNGKALSEPPRTLLLHELIAPSIERTPNAVALRFRGESLSFAELDAAAAVFAQNLLAAGVCSGDTVAVACPRRFELFSLTLGLFRIGASFLHLEGNEPAPRAREMLHIARVRLIVEGPGHRSRLEGVAIPRAEMDELSTPPAAPRRLPPVDPEATAYLLFTSGSTGVPKGVRRSHRMCASRVHWEQSLYRFRSTERYLLKSALTFREFIWPLSFGATAIIAEPEGEKDDRYLVELLRTEQISVVSFVPSMMRVLTASAGFSACRHLRHVFVGGEALSRDLERTLRGSFGVEVHNTYTMTEADYVCHRREATDAPDGVSIIGRPTDMQVYLCDTRGELVPRGIIGEIYTGGPGLSSGYVGREDLTAERFVPNRFDANPPLLFRSGDLARFRQDGQLEYVGRADHQVKIRGLRVEPAEVESRLLEHPAVEATAVVGLPDPEQGSKLVAYIVSGPHPQPSSSELRAHLERALPAHFVPSAFVPLSALPLLPSGKLDRRALPAPGRQRPVLQTPHRAAATEPERRISQAWLQVLRVEGIGVDDAFVDVGGDSLLLMSLRSRLSQDFGREIPVGLLLENATVAMQAVALQPLARPQANAPPARSSDGRESGTAVAIVGVALRVSGASTLAELWAMLDGVKEGILRGEDRPSQQRSGPRPGYVDAISSIEGADLFDASAFRIAPREAMLTDPQHRLLLEVVNESLDDAALDPARLSGSVGVFASAGRNQHEQVLRDTAARNGVLLDETYLELGHQHDYLATKVSYRLGLKGPSLNVQAACASGLAAVHLACQSLRAGECAAAIVGASSVRYSTEGSGAYDPGAIGSRDGRCRAFDEHASGAVPADGVIALVLRRVDDAHREGHRIHGIIRGSAMNNDGQKVGFGNVSRQAQVAVVRAAQEAAGVDPEPIAFVEAHGTGTPVGDEVELSALAEVFATRSDRPCFVSSVKANLGHVREASGLLGLLKAIVVLDKQQLPPMPHFTRMAPSVEREVAGRGIDVSTRRQALPDGVALLAGVSSFGLGGTNVHAIIEAPPRRAPGASTKQRLQLLPLSARTPAALADYSRRAADAAGRLPGDALGSLAHTLQQRRASSQRSVILAHDMDGFVAALAANASEARDDGQRLPGRVRVAFIFPGLGDQYVQMAQGLFERFPSFRSDLERHANIVREELGLDLFDALHWDRPLEAPRPSDPLWRLLNRNPGVTALDEPPVLSQTNVVHPALFSIQTALVRLLATFGVEPDVVLGHSLGEFAAAVAAGALDEESALRLVCRRAEVLQRQPRASLLAVLQSEERLRRYEQAGITIAAINAPEQGVLAGPSGAIQRLAAELLQAGVAHRVVPSEHAFHSAHVRAATAELLDCFREIRWQAPTRRWLSSITAEEIPSSVPIDSTYWLRQVSEPVRFFDASRKLSAHADVFIEIGPGSASSWLRQTMAAVERREEDYSLVPLMRRAFEGESDERFLLRALGRLWLAGVELDWASAADPAAQRLSFPSPAPDRQSFAVTADNLGDGPERVASPLTPTEALTYDSDTEALATLWMRLLGCTRPRAFDSFFDLGGDSLLGIRLRRLVEEAFGVDVAPASLFWNPTLCGMAATIRQQPSNTAARA